MAFLILERVLSRLTFRSQSLCLVVGTIFVLGFVLDLGGLGSLKLGLGLDLGGDDDVYDHTKPRNTCQVAFSNSNAPIDN